MPLNYLLAALPVLILLGLMVGLRWSAQRAGPASWLFGVLIAGLAFGLTPAVLWVSQLRGLLLALFVLAVMWPALLLYNIVDRTGGIRALAQGLQRVIGDPGLLVLVLAWAFSGLLEGLAGFGLPIAVVSPMLVVLGVNPVIAVASVAAGHAWSVTFGDMGVIFQTLAAVVQMDPAVLAPAAAGMLGAACLACGLAAAHILGQIRLWPVVLGLGLLMAAVQYGMAVGGLAPLAAFFAGLSGVAGAVFYSRLKPARPAPASTDSSVAQTAAAREDPPGRAAQPAFFSPALVGALAAYGGLAVLMTAIAWPGPLRAALLPTVWQMSFPEVITRSGFITPAGAGTAFRPFTHPGTAILLAAMLSFAVFRWLRLCQPSDLGGAARATWRSAAPASVGIIATVGLSTLMEHSGMTQLLAQGMANLMGAAFPLASPLVGILGAFATGSNNNSNVLFAPLQKSAAALLSIDPSLLLATQTAGGALGSMLAPAKITVGCSTVGLKGREGDVLRRTLLPGLLIGLLLGAIALLV
jgi:lactate permease